AGRPGERGTAPGGRPVRAHGDGSAGAGPRAGAAPRLRLLHGRGARPARLRTAAAGVRLVRAATAGGRRGLLTSRRWLPVRRLRRTGYAPDISAGAEGAAGDGHGWHRALSTSQTGGEPDGGGGAGPGGPARVPPGPSAQVAALPAPVEVLR